MSTIYKIKARIDYLLRARHSKGHRIHSPYLFRFLNDVLFENKEYYCYEGISELRWRLMKDGTVITTPAIGTQKREKRQTVGKIARLSSKPDKQAQLLHRICVDMGAKTIVELGTNLGLTTLLLASANKEEVNVVTFDGSAPVLDIARRNFEEMEIKNIEIVEGDIDLTLRERVDKLEKIDFAFLDANHTYDATMRYFNICKKKAHKGSIFVFDDIHRSKDMNRAWKDICEHEEVSASIDIYHLGIIWFNEDLHKRTYYVRY